MLTEATDNNSLLISYLTLRKWVGILGISLPFILLIGEGFLGIRFHVEDSISDFYYTNMGHYLVGTLCAVALFLFCYKGYNDNPKFYKNDSAICNLAGAFALGVAFFPTKQVETYSSPNRILCQNSSTWVGNLHYLFASLLFLTLAYICLVLFTISNDPNGPSDMKLRRNQTYKFCGWTILFCIFLILLEKNIPFLHEALKPYKPVFCLESISLIAFGFSWIVKGEFIMKD